MSARMLVAYAASTGFTARDAAEVATEIAGVEGVEIDIRPIAYVASIRPYVAVYLGWSRDCSAGQREMARFLQRNATLLADRRIWVVQRRCTGGQSGSPRRATLKLSRLRVRPGLGPGYPVPTFEPADLPAGALPAPSPAGDGMPTGQPLSA